MQNGGRLHFDKATTNNRVCSLCTSLNVGMRPDLPLTGAREGLRLSRWWKKILSLLKFGGTPAASPLALLRTRLGGWGFLKSWGGKRTRFQSFDM